MRFIFRIYFIVFTCLLFGMLAWNFKGFPGEVNKVFLLGLFWCGVGMGINTNGFLNWADKLIRKK